MSERTETVPSTENRNEEGGFSERHPFLAYLASHWEPLTIGSTIPITILGGGFILFGNGVDPIYPQYRPEAVEVGIALIRSAAILWTIYGVAKVGTILTASVQRFTQDHLRQHK